MGRKKKKMGIFGRISLVLGIVLSIYLVSVNAYLYNLNSNLKQELEQLKDVQDNKKDTVSFSNSQEVNVVSINLPAVNRDGRGVSTTLKVKASKGTGKTLVDIDGLFFWTDTQGSIRMAKEVASEVTNMDLSEIDLVYSISAGEAQLISGPSAGAALTIATIAAIQGKDLNDNVMITGTVNHDGTIGPVGEIEQKAAAAKSAGAEIFLVPLLQSQEIIYERSEHCQKFGRSQFCTVEQIPKKVNVEEKVGIKVIEIQTISESLKYFFNE